MHIPQQRAHRHPTNYIYPCWHNIIPQLLAAYIQYQYINSNGIYSPSVGNISYSQNRLVYIQYKFIFQKMHIPQPCPKGRTGNRHPPNMTYIPQLLAEYNPPIVGSIYPIPKYKSLNRWQYISNMNLYFRKFTFHNPAPKVRTGTHQMTYTPCWQNISNTNI